MTEDAEAYQQLVRELRERVPDLAQQITDAVDRGKEIFGSEIDPNEKERRNQQIMESEGLGRIGKADVSVIPYDDTERLFLLVDAVTTATESFAESQEALLELVHETGVESNTIHFWPPTGVGEPEEDDSRSLLDTSSRSAAEQLRRVRDELRREGGLG